MIMNIIKANKGLVKKVLVFGGLTIATAIAVIVVNTKTDAEELLTEEAEVIDVEAMEEETEVEE